jgi:xanthine dehydrogenase accessory factor
MNFSLLDKLDAVENGILATVLHSEGHTYKKPGAKALFAAGRPAPVWGNLGSLCVDQELLRQGGEARRDGMPRTIEIDTREKEDVDFGYGTFCGGLMKILLEPVLDAHKQVYRTVRTRLAGRKHACLEHDLESGNIRVRDDEPAARDGVFVESFSPLQELCVFGATPLARRLLVCLEDMDYNIHVVDWRDDYLDGFRRIDGVSAHLDDYAFGEGSVVLALSHDFRRDKNVLKEALAKKCAWVGMLSSRSRRDKMFEELRGEGVSEAEVDRVSSPVGIDIGGRSDAEIAVAIAAELVAFRNK